MAYMEEVKSFVEQLSPEQTVVLLNIMESDVGREDLHSLCLYKKQEAEDPED